MMENIKESVYIYIYIYIYPNHVCDENGKNGWFPIETSQWFNFFIMSLKVMIIHRKIVETMVIILNDLAKSGYKPDM